MPHREFTKWLLLLLFFFQCYYRITADTGGDDDDRGDDNNGPNDKETEPVVVIIFCFFGLLLGTVISQLLSIYGEMVPYTVVVFLVGLLFAMSSKNGTLGESVKSWASIDADLMLFVFLPPVRIYVVEMGAPFCSSRKRVRL